MNDSGDRNDAPDLSSVLDDERRLASMAPDELRTAMRTLGYKTQNELAAAIGVSRSAVSLWLEGKVGVPRPVAMLLRMLVAARRRAF
ncbi:MAG: helix-turn-helix domain-containing protein [Sphingomicrobium sp.]